MRGIDRAKADLDTGDARKARDRLKGLLGTYPESIEVRSLLAEAYRMDRQFPEAGRWGYLDGSAATDAERRAFEVHCAFGWRTRITAARLRHLLRCSDLGAIADQEGLRILRELPTKRLDGRADRPLARLARLIATYRASWRRR